MGWVVTPFRGLGLGSYTIARLFAWPAICNHESQLMAGSITAQALEPLHSAAAALAHISSTSRPSLYTQGQARARCMSWPSLHTHKDRQALSLHIDARTHIRMRPNSCPEIYACTAGNEQGSAARLATHTRAHTHTYIHTHTRMPPNTPGPRFATRAARPVQNTWKHTRPGQGQRQGGGGGGLGGGAEGHTRPCPCICTPQAPPGPHHPPPCTPPLRRRPPTPTTIGKQ